ncbi:PP2C family protein-serine/threonine phosphatase [Streptomyces sp. NBC_00094]|uniref:PP2C family protein-serine/threonine phosphatase n=1 Tax=Streptomyces sp. NBC_00094 TaxID=2903620 RepID=UPI002253CF1C|nr:PP2C family protein-serine/threonine phosphatase [Streptomyces sp. NBC_00094]MCX5391152.1 serine/threonine-protein phosphatase [Streptomyces sp. NBC_00094]
MKTPAYHLATHRSWAVPSAAMSIVVVAATAAGPGFGLLPLYAAGPALAAARGTTVTVLSMAAVAAGLCLFSATMDGNLGQTRLLIALGGNAVVTAAACYVSRVRCRAEQDLVDVREVAEVVQDVLVPPLPSQDGPIRLTGSYLSATKAARVGGDLYQAVHVTDGVRIMVADVQGKGLDALHTATLVLNAFRDAARGPHSLEEVPAHIEEALGSRTEGDRFVTGIIAEVHHDGTVDLLNCGHPAPLVRRADGTLELAHPAEPAPPLGLTGLREFGDLDAAAPVATHLVLAPGERMLFYTDGLSEARDPEGEFYPVLDRAQGPLGHPEPDLALEQLRADVEIHTGSGGDDDSALLLLHLEGVA